jgi:thiamine-phosphate pyrophosphorylase
MIIQKGAFKSGIYLVVDPSMNEEELMTKLKLILPKDLAAVQIWDNFNDQNDNILLIQKIHSLCAQYQTPVLINNHWEYLKVIELEGVHFDEIPSNLEEIKREIGRGFYIGITCGNELVNVRRAVVHDIDYISFCSMFPSSSVDNCEIVDYETVKQAESIFNKPLFLAGGINPENINKLNPLKYDGIAVISGVMNSENPDKVIDEYRQNLKLKK